MIASSRRKRAPAKKPINVRSRAGVVALRAEDVAHDGVVGEAVAQDVNDVVGPGWTVEQGGVEHDPRVERREKRATFVEG